MNSLLSKNVFFIKEHRGIFKAANSYDIYDSETQALAMECREPNLGFFTKMFRFTDYKRNTPFDVQISTPQGQRILNVKRGVTIFRSVVEVFDENDTLVGRFRQRMLSIGGKFDILDENDVVLCTLQGKWTSWEFSFMKDNVKLAMVTKKWAGIGRELFTSADNYALSIEPTVAATDDVRLLILAAVMCIDMVLKE
jgi:uncharacterized protein YxjI